MPVNYDINDGAQALDQNLVLKALDGFAWISGLEATADSEGMMVDFSAGEAFVGGSVKSVSVDAVSISEADSEDPRKDLIYVDSLGELAVAEGEPNPARPVGLDRCQTYAPAPPAVPDVNGTPLWEVWVAAGATEIVSNDLRDRRVPSDVVFNELRAEAVELTSVSSEPNHALRNGTFDTHVDNNDAHHPQDHGSRHHRGGDDELDAADLGFSGEDGDHLQIEGTELVWDSGPTVGGGVGPYWEPGEQISVYETEGSDLRDGETLVNLTGVSGVLFGGYVSGQGTGSFTIHADGETLSAPTLEFYGGGSSDYGTNIPATKFDNSLEVIVSVNGFNSGSARIYVVTN